jgi:predicted permease
MALERTLPILVLFLVGVGLKKARLLRKEDGPMLSRLILTVVLPATIIHTLSSMDISASLFLLPGAAIVVVIIFFGSSFILAYLLGLQGKTRAAFLISFPTLEVSSIGYAFMTSMYGTDGLARIVLFDLGDSLVFFLLVPFLSAALGQSGKKVRMSDVLIQFVKSPVPWAYAVGIFMNLSHIENAFLANLSSALSQPLLLLVMFLIAIEFEFSFSSFSLPALAMYLKMSFGLIVGLLVSLLFGFTGIERIAVVLGSSLPAALLTIVYAREHGLDSQFLASMLSLALPTAIGFSFILISISH